MGRVPLGLQSGDGDAGEAVDFESANDAAKVVRMDAQGGGRVEGGQLFVELCGAFARSPVVELGTDPFIGARAFEEPFDERTQVKKGAGNEYRRTNCGEVGLRFVDKSGRGVRFPRIGNINHEMRNATAGGRIRLGGSDVHPAVDLHGIDGHERRMKVLGKRFREVAFARGGAAENDEGFGRRGVQGGTLKRELQFRCGSPR
jgi:hypothetical protein